MTAPLFLSVEWKKIKKEKEGKEGEGRGGKKEEDFRGSMCDLKAEKAEVYSKSRAKPEK